MATLARRGAASDAEAREDSAMLLAVDSPSAEARDLQPVPPQDEEDTRENSSAGVSTPGADIYDSVVVAAFGGVQQQLSMEKRTLVHPMVLFALCIPLVVAQISALIFLKLAQDPHAKVWTDTNDEQRDRIHNKLKLLMVIIVQLILFDKIMRAVRLFLFLLNPVSWEEVLGPQHRELEMRMKWLFHPLLLAPWAMIAIFVHSIVDYNICIDSVSIVLASTDVKETIYDSLAITFLADLGAMWWKVVSTVFHIEEFTDFEFKMAPMELREKVKAQSILKISDWVRNVLPMLSRDHGAQRLNSSIAVAVMVIIYVRQIIMVLDAVDSDILPVARDVCTLRSMNTGTGPCDMFWRFFEAHLLVADPTKAIVEATYCNETYHRVLVSDYSRILGSYPKASASSMGAVVIFLGLPQIYFLFFKRIQVWMHPPSLRRAVEETSKPRRTPGAEAIEDLQRTVLRLQDRVKEESDARQLAEARMEKLQADLRSEFQEELRKERARQSKEAQAMVHEELQRFANSSSPPKKKWF